MFDMIWARWFPPEASNYAGGVRPCNGPAGLGEVNDEELNRIDEAIKSSALGGKEYVKFSYLCEMLPEPIRKYRKMIHEFIPEVIEQAYGKEKESLHVGGFIGALLGFKTGLVDDLPRNLCRDALELLFDPLGTVCDIIDSVMPNNPDNCVAQIMRAWQSGDDFSRGRIAGNITGQVAIIVASKKFSAKVASGRALEVASAASEVGSAAGVAEAAGEAASVAKEAQSAASVAKGVEAASKAASIAKETQSAAKVAKSAEAASKAASVAKETQSAAKVAKGAETVAKSTAGTAKSAETVAKSTAGTAKSAETVAKGTKAASGANTAVKEAKSTAGVAKGTSVVRETVTATKSETVAESVIRCGKTLTKITPEMEKKILEGQRRVPIKNEVIGGHSPQISNSSELFAVEELSVNADGTRNIRFVKDLPDGNISKIKKSTVFPDSWSDSKIIDAIKEVGDSPIISVRGRDGATWHRKIIDGVEVDVIKLGNDVVSGYPTGKIGAPKPSGF